MGGSKLSFKLSRLFRLSSLELPQPLSSFGFDLNGNCEIPFSQSNQFEFIVGQLEI